MTPPVLWTTAECAEYLGVDPVTWRSYVARVEGCPQPIEGQFGPKGARLYRATQVKRWHTKRPGSGARTDLIRTTD